MKLRRKSAATDPLRERVVGGDAYAFDESTCNGAGNSCAIDFREANSERFMPPRRRRLKKSRCVCMMLWGATAYFGVVRMAYGVWLLCLLADS